VDANRDAAGAGGRVVARQRALASIVEPSVRVERQGMRRDGESSSECLAKFRDHHALLTPS
jgi:hypothetical protein